MVAKRHVAVDITHSSIIVLFLPVHCAASHTEGGLSIMYGRKDWLCISAPYNLTKNQNIPFRARLLWVPSYMLITHRNVQLLPFVQIYSVLPSKKPR